MVKFNMNIATFCGVNAAVIAEFLADNIRSGNAYEHDDKKWCRCSILMMTGHMPFLTRHMVADALNRLVETNVIKKGCFNQNRFDHTNWYTFTDYGRLLLTYDEENTDKRKVAAKRPKVVLDNDKCLSCIYYDAEKESCGVCVKDILGDVKKKYVM